MRASLLVVTCAIGSTCDRAAPLQGEENVVYAPVAIETTTVTPPSPPVALSSGPFWDPMGNARAVPILRADAPNMRYAALDPSSCEAELSRRTIAFVRGEPTVGVLMPVRLRGPLHGVSVHSMLAPKDREHAAMEIFDCRLVLALDDFSAMVAQRGVVEMIHLSAYRPRSQLGCTAKYDGKQHCAALAVDVANFKRADGSSLSVERDFHGHIGNGTCPAPAPSNELWRIVCDAADRAMFNVILTPNFNAQHFNHFHLEITPDAAWMMVH